MRTYCTVGLLVVGLSLFACGSSSDAGTQTPGEPNVFAGGGSALDSTIVSSAATTDATGGASASGGNASTGGAEDVSAGGASVAATGGGAATGGALATGWNQATGGSAVVCQPGSIGCPCRSGSCDGDLACHPQLNECVTVPACAGHQGFTCLYGPCTDGSTCYPEYGFTCGTDPSLAEVSGISLGPKLDCRTRPDACTTHAGC